LEQDELAQLLLDEDIMGDDVLSKT